MKFTRRHGEEQKEMETKTAANYCSRSVLIMTGSLAELVAVLSSTCVTGNEGIQPIWQQIFNDWVSNSSGAFYINQFMYYASYYL